MKFVTWLRIKQTNKCSLPVRKQTTIGSTIPYNMGHTGYTNGTFIKIFQEHNTGHCNNTESMVAKHKIEQHTPHA